MSQTTRKDPSPTSFDVPQMGMVINPEPGRHYVYAHSEDGQHQNVQYYEMLGYRTELCTKGGVRVAQGEKAREGDPLRFWGMVLMSCSPERKAQIDEHGPDGRTGRHLSRAIQNKINKVGLQDGVNRRVARIVNETTPLIVEG